MRVHVFEISFANSFFRLSANAACTVSRTLLSTWYKLFTTLFFALPKLAIGGILWWCGGSYVALSPDNAELILNTVAVLCVLQF